MTNRRLRRLPSPRSGSQVAAVYAYTGMIASLPALAVLAVLAWLPAVANAEFGPATLLSGTQRLQFDKADAPALSQDGRYAVFQGSLADVPGVYRRDLQTGEVELVAGAASAGASLAEAAVGAPDATAPSISADGRYVAFTSTADLDPAEEPNADRGCPEVYVRDMGLPPTAPGAYELASALDGTSEGIAYGGGCPAPASSGFQLAGAQAAAGVALSADGRDVVFTVLSYSSLGAHSGCGGPPEYTGCTPPGQVVVRDLETDTTTIASVTPEGHATPGGGAFPSVGSLAESTAKGAVVGAGVASLYGDQLTGSSAAISADASTVAWLGTDVSAQVSPMEAERAPSLSPRPSGREAEPLWRRVADGPGAVTRRLLAGAGLDFFYAGADEGFEPVTSGSLVGLHELVFVPPALSADGRTAAVLSSAPAPATEASLAGRITGVSELGTDAYVVHVEDDPAAPPVVTPITEIATYAAPQAGVADVKDIAVSPDGTRVAFDTARTQLFLPSLALVSPPGVYTQTSETYEADLERDTLQRVTSTYDGSEPNGDAGLLAFGSDGQTLAFASQATNLFFGDALAETEVYTARELPSTAVPAVEEIGAPPAPVAPSPDWRLSVTATAEADGSVLVHAQTPGAGRLVVKAGAQLPSPTKHVALRPSRHAGARRAAHTRAVRPSATKAEKDRRRPNTGVVVPARTVAQATTTTKGSTEVRLRLRVSAAYKTLVAGRDGLYAVLRVTFAAPGHETLVMEVPVTFRVSTHKRTRRKLSARRAAAGRRVKQ